MFLRLYLVALPVFLVIDMVWLGLLARSFYKKHLGFLMRPDLQWPAAIAFYLVFVVGLVLFVIEPALQKASWAQAIYRGALFGFVCYATYDLTNLATLKDWPVAVTVADLVWGATLAASVSVITFLVAKKLEWQP